MLLRKLGLFVAGAAALSGQTTAARPPILDVHLHAIPVAQFGPPPVPTCAGQLEFLPRDPQEPYTFDRFASCASALKSSTTDAELMKQTLTLLERYNITAVTSGPPSLVQQWMAVAPKRIIPGITANGQIPADTLRKLAAEGNLKVLGELTFQYAGRLAGDPAAESYFALAEELDLPVGMHVGPGPPGAPYVGTPNYRMRLSDPLLLEDVLVKHPKMRFYVMHAGWPMGDRMVGLLYAHPQVYVDIAVIDWFLPRKEFHAYLKRLV